MDSVFSKLSSRLPDDTVSYAIYPDQSLISFSPQESLQCLHLEILNSLSPYTSSYLWQHQPFSLSLSLSPLPHLRGHLRFGDNIDDEWFVVFLLFHVSRSFPSLSIRVWDSDGEFLLIEAAFHLPRWLNPETSENRVFIRKGDLHIIPRKKFKNSPSLVESLGFLIDCEGESRAADGVQSAVKARVEEYPEKAERNIHRARVRVPVSVARVLREEPCLISLAVEGFYDRDVDMMKRAGKMERFLEKGREEELVLVGVRMSRAMYAQLVQQKFQAPKCYPMPRREGGDVEGYLEAELGMKIACGFEMMYWLRKKEGEKGKGSTWMKYLESLEKSRYFDGLLPGSVEYKRLMEKAEEYYQNSSMFERTSESMSAPVRRIDEILALPYSADKLGSENVAPSDDDSWLYNREDELNSALYQRQKEMDLYNEKQKRKQKSKEPQETCPSASSNLDNFDPGDMVKAMHAFVDKVSSYRGAEVSEDRKLEDVDLDVECFLKDMESVMNGHGPEDSDNDAEDGSLCDMDFDDSEDESDIGNNEDAEDAFMQTYSNALDEQLKNTTLETSFVRANKSCVEHEGTSKGTEDMEEEFTPVDVDINLVKSLLDSFSTQQGQPGPASNLLGLMGINLPQNADKGK